MLEWSYHDYRPEGFECCEVSLSTDYKIFVCKIGGTRYTVRWHYKGMTEIKEYIDAKDWDEAKASAISIIRDYLKRRATYWRDMHIWFNNRVKED